MQQIWPAINRLRKIWSYYCGKYYTSATLFLTATLSILGEIWDVLGIFLDGNDLEFTIIV